MALSKESVSISAIILSLTVLTSVSGITTLSKSQHYPSHQVTFDGYSFGKKSLTYMSCDKSNLEMQPKRTCKVYLDRNILDDRSVPMSCQVIMEVEGQNHLVDRSLRVLPFTEDKSIVAWSEVSKGKINRTTIARFTIVQFPECQTAQQASVDLNETKLGQFYIYSLAIVPNDANATFEVVYANRKLCGGRLCKQTFAADGSKLGDSIAWFPSEKDPFGLLVHPLSSPKGYFVYLKANGDNFAKISVVNDNGMTLLKTYENEVCAESALADAISVCYRNNKTIECIRYKSNGDLQFESSFDFENDDYPAQIYNTEDDGFLLLTSQPTESPKKILYYDQKMNYQVTKIDSDGMKTASLHLGKIINCNNHRMQPLGQFYRNEDTDEYCVSYACVYNYYHSIDEHSGRLNLITKCFSDDELVSDDL